MAANALRTNANGLANGPAKPAALFFGADVAVLLAPAPEPDAPLGLEPEPAVDDAAEPSVLVRVAMLMVVLRLMAVPVPAETAVPPMVVVGMLELRLAMIELTVPFNEAIAELADADAMDAELVAEAEETAEAEPPDSEN